MSAVPRRILVTGAAGRLGRASRPALLAAGHAVCSTDLPGVTLEPLGDERHVAGDLRDPAFLDTLLPGTDVVVHYAGAVGDKSFGDVLEHNHRLVYELYEGARRHGVSRIVYASSNHAFGLHPVATKLRLDAPYRADCHYGLSKVWGETFARMYWAKHGIETVALRIGTFMDCPPRSARELASWLGREDLHRLVLRAIDAEGVGFAPVWGISANTRAWYDLAEPNAIGYEPQQDAEDWAAALSAQPASTPDPVADHFQGGRFVTGDWTPEDRRPMRRSRG